MKRFFFANTVSRMEMWLFGFLMVFIVQQQWIASAVSFGVLILCSIMGARWYPIEKE